MDKFWFWLVSATGLFFGALIFYILLAHGDVSLGLEKNAFDFIGTETKYFTSGSGS